MSKEDRAIFKQLDTVTTEIKGSKNKLTKLINILEGRRTDLSNLIIEAADAVKWSQFDETHLRSFIQEPYVIEPHRLRGSKVIEWRVYVPKMVSFQVGRLERATHSYNVFAVNQYMRWFAEIPDELIGRFPKIEVNVQIHDGLLVTTPEQLEPAYAKYKKFLIRREGPGSARIKKKTEWELIAQILEDGGLPFAPHPIDKVDLRKSITGGFALNKKWKMRDYQKNAWDLFLEYGAIGIYWPFGCGKSQFGLELCDRIVGPKLIIAGGSKALREQWEMRLEAMNDERRAECHVLLYQSQTAIDKLIKKYKEFTAVIFDECHHLPAKTFMRLSTIPTKYRLGLTGSPYREDGHINYIMALTGMPHGLAWSQFVTEGIISLAQIQVHVVRRQKNKLGLLDQLLQRDLGKTFIFCDSLDLGEEIAKKYGIPWIYGATKDRMEKIDRNERIVISRVGDEGLSIPALDTVIEVDFLGGSRAQALQRAGRLQHRLLTPDQEPAIHHVLMTEEEVEKYGKRILAYYDKGFKVDWLHNF